MSRNLFSASSIACCWPPFIDTGFSELLSLVFCPVAKCGNAQTSHQKPVTLVHPFQGPPSETTNRKASSMPPTKGRILCTEDDVDTRELIDFVLTQYGYEVVCSAS